MILGCRPIKGLIWLSALIMVTMVLSRLPLSSISTTISALSPLQWIGWITLNLFIIYVFVFRWSVLAKSVGLSVSRLQLLLIRQAGQVISFITPGPQFGGEPMQVYWLWKKYSCAGDLSLLTVALDRFYELWINFMFLLFGILILLLIPAENFTNVATIGVIIIILILGLSLLAWILLCQRQRVSVWIKKLVSRWKNNSILINLDAHWDAITSKLGIAVTNNKQALIFTFFISIIGWFGMILELWLLLSFLGLSLKLVDFIFLLVAIRVSFLLPIPGGVGTMEAALFWVFLSLDLSGVAAIGLIALIRLRDAIIMIGGLISLRSLSKNN